MPDPVVRRAADGQARHPGDVGADPGDPVEVADGVLRQRATPPLHVAVDRARSDARERGQLGQRVGDQRVVAALQRGLLAVPPGRGAEQQQRPPPASRTQSHFAKEYVAALMPRPSTGGTRKPDAGVSARSTAGRPPGTRG